MLFSTMVITQCDLRKEYMFYTSAHISGPRKHPNMSWIAFDMKLYNDSDVLLPGSVYPQPK